MAAAAIWGWFKKYPVPCAKIDKGDVIVFFKIGVTDS